MKTDCIKYLAVLTFLVTLGTEVLGQEPNDVGLRSAVIPLKILDKETLRGMSANNLAEALRFELNVEIEQAPEIGGARMRAFDLNSRHIKILVNGVPVSGSDMFGGHVDISSIPLNRVERIEISDAPLGVAYGSGTLAKVINIVTLPDTATAPIGTSAYASVYEQAIAGEYNLKASYGAKGRHVQQLGVQHLGPSGLFFGIDLQRDAFKGVWDDYSGNLHQPDYTNSRGYAWSPAIALNGDTFIGYRNDKLSLFYSYGISDMDISAYGRINNQEYRDGGYLDFYTATDQRYRYRRQLHHAQLKGQVWQDATLAIDVSYQDAGTRRRTSWVRTADNVTLDDTPLAKLYGVRTWYSKGTLDKPVLSDRLDWTLGYEAGWTKASTGAQPGTYTSREIDEDIAQISGFSYLRWKPFAAFVVQPALRISYHHTLSHVDPLPSLSLAYNAGRHRFGLVSEKVNRFPNQREMFTYLDSELSLLKGSTDLHPERGLALLADWRYRIPTNNGLNVQTTLSSGYRRLKDRIIIVAVPQTDAQQERYLYANRQTHQSWSNRAEVEVSKERWHIQAAYTLLGLRGNDFSDSGQYDRYLFHSEAGILGRYTLLKNYWVQLNYRYVGSQPIYSFEREYGSLEIDRVHNHAPAYRLADLNIGGSLLNGRLGIIVGGRNLFDSTSARFEATDRQEHYRGDLRTIYTGYGRSFTFRVTYQR
ncbi:TonB-dependent siderophore receptor [Sphingobacterium sp. JB170]|uniref:TonB-dependent receptor plug domain-containing protein n=1 Tax=Sphingobacterium sp. JB170 TaxID=1434842 RepID=UPI00097F563F|nr:TonB-dependent receptor plug domain-containing protein [Sphingobacterium sp. JB170]SJN22696.1 tonB-dependent outer membrane receptor [Sphingobacterium sp. JB170]